MYELRYAVPRTNPIVSHGSPIGAQLTMFTLAWGHSVSLVYALQAAKPCDGIRALPSAAHASSFTGLLRQHHQKVQGQLPAEPLSDGRQPCIGIALAWSVYFFFGD